MSKSARPALKKSPQTFRRRSSIDWGGTNAACEALGPGMETLARDMVTRMAEKWTLWTLAVLAEAGDALFASNGESGGRKPEVANEDLAAIGA